MKNIIIASVALLVSHVNIHSMTLCEIEAVGTFYGNQACLCKIEKGNCDDPGPGNSWCLNPFTVGDDCYRRREGPFKDVICQSIDNENSNCAPYTGDGSYCTMYKDGKCIWTSVGLVPVPQCDITTGTEHYYGIALLAFGNACP